MRILLACQHRYPASGETGSGLHPKEFPSGSAYHLHDLLAQGLAELGHDVFYLLQQGAEVPLPRVSAWFVDPFRMLTSTTREPALRNIQMRSSSWRPATVH